MSPKRRGAKKKKSQNQSLFWSEDQSKQDLMRGSEMDEGYYHDIGKDKDKDLREEY